MLARLLQFAALVLLPVAVTVAAPTGPLKPRIVVLTDIGPSEIEPDDHESMVRLLCYADRFEIEAVIAGSGWNTSGRTYPPEWMDILRGTLDAYEKDVPNLMKRSAQTAFRADEDRQELGYWPSPAYLRSRAMLGSTRLGFAALGEGNDSAGSEFLIRLAAEPDPRPIWICVWGGANTFAQAVWRVQQQGDQERLKDFLHKFRVYTITDQDKDWGKTVPFAISSHQWLRREFEKDLVFLWDESAWLFQNETGKSNWATYEKEIQGHGHLGCEYPKFKWGVEGDTPSFLYVMPNGLNDPENPGAGGWGGFFARGTGPDGVTTSFVNQPGTPTSLVSRKYEERFYPAIFNDFVARIRWAEQGAGNHNPFVVINGDSTSVPLAFACEPGASLTLDASASTDPDRDALHFSWWVLPEAGDYCAPVAVTAADTSRATVSIPKDSAGRKFHLICEVTDNGVPRLTSYRRVLVTPVTGRSR
jgi:hypothetical protein